MAKKMRIYYRGEGYVPLWKVMEEGGFLAKHGLEMQMGSLEGQRKRAAEGLKSGDLDVVSAIITTCMCARRSTMTHTCISPKAITAGGKIILSAARASMACWI